MQNNDVKWEKRKLPFEQGEVQIWTCTFSAPLHPPHLLGISGPSQRLQTFSAPPQLLSIFSEFGSEKVLKRCGDAGVPNLHFPPCFERVFKDAFYFICSRFFR
jgi:hypothetical protein